ncbi:hypothetical protein WJX73_010030 [Symbiochloris irregularis]|uniref:Uncharacterized protein n=1 Tax=Symbiochloris irregularis TaxID=706552 RepID=A0AAW1PDQ9_9CHLO
MQGHWEQALHDSDELVQEASNPLESALVHCYAAEAMYCMGKLQEASERLGLAAAAATITDATRESEAKQADGLLQCIAANRALVTACLGKAMQNSAHEPGTAEAAPSLFSAGRGLAGSDDLKQLSELVQHMQSGRCDDALKLIRRQQPPLSAMLQAAV